jgi:hypothetical protein
MGKANCMSKSVEYREYAISSTPATIGEERMAVED